MDCDPGNLACCFVEAGDGTMVYEHRSLSRRGFGQAQSQANIVKLPIGIPQPCDGALVGHFGKLQAQFGCIECSGPAPFPPSGEQVVTQEAQPVIDLSPAPFNRDDKPLRLHMSCSVVEHTVSFA